MNINISKPVNVFLVEDNPGDVRLIQEVFKEAKINNVLHIARDGEEAIHMLNPEGNPNLPHVPDLILLDLNLPKKDGRDVLIEIKNNERLKCIPVVVLTSSNREEDLIESYKNNANCYISKPTELNKLIQVIKNIGEFWLDIVKLPPR
ncbi:MAG: response regulator [Methanobacterium sp.]|jgi:CheY-like chemotaxis protein|nr:response regulator [Methanobacterium sp.]